MNEQCLSVESDCVIDYHVLDEESWARPHEIKSICIGIVQLI